MGENAGFDKEREVVASLNKKLFKDICPTYQKLIKDKIPTVNPDEGVLCEKKEGRGVEKKTDLIITVRNQKINLSVKCGSGNSVHQENIDEFIKYLDNVSPLNQAEKNSIYDFHWCDGTYDNKGSVLDRKKRLSYRKSNENDYTILFITNKNHNSCFSFSLPIVFRNLIFYIKYVPQKIRGY